MPLVAKLVGLSVGSFVACLTYSQITTSLYIRRVGKQLNRDSKALTDFKNSLNIKL